MKISMARISDAPEDVNAQDHAAHLKDEVLRADPETIRLLLTEARSHNGWTDRPVSEDILRELYDLMKWGPTSMNQQPARYIFAAMMIQFSTMHFATAPCKAPILCFLRGRLVSIAGQYRG